MRFIIHIDEISHRTFAVSHLPSPLPADLPTYHKRSRTFPTPSELEYYNHCTVACARFNDCGVSNDNPVLAAMFRNAADKQCGGDCSRFPCPTPLLGVNKGDVGWEVVQKDGPGTGTAGSNEL